MRKDKNAGSNAEDFSKRLDRLISEQKLTLREITKRTGIPKSTIQDWRSGLAPTDFEALKYLAEALKTSLSQLLIGEDDSKRAGKLNKRVAQEMTFEGLYQITLRRLTREENRDEEKG